MTKKFRHSPKDQDLSPEALQKRADRRTKAERNAEVEQRRIKGERAKVLSTALDVYGNCGLMAIKGYDDEIVSKFRESYAAIASDKLLLLEADGTIQGEDLGEAFAESTIATIAEHSGKLGAAGVLGFEEADFGGIAGNGTPRVAEYVAGLLAASRQKPRTGLAIVAFGSGVPADLLASHDYDRQLDRGLIGEFDMTLGLSPRGEPLAVLDLPNSYLPKRLPAD